MENNIICAVCGQKMKWISPGFSQRTNKSYQGFWSCPNRCPKPVRPSALAQPAGQSYAHSPQSATFPQPPTPSYNPQSASLPPVDYSQPIYNQTAKFAARAEEKKWEDISRGKVRHGVSCEFIRLGEFLNQDTVDLIKQWTDFIMTGNLTKNERSELDTEDGEVNGEIDVSGIPFH